MLRNFKVLLAVLVILVIAGGAYAFAASNDVELSAAGYSPIVVSGYDISDIAYDLNEETPTTVDKITFAIDPAVEGDPEAETVYLQTKVGGPWTLCAVTTNLTVSTVVCTPTISPAVAEVTAMNIVASSSEDAPAP
jgi:hypothetical protein